MDTGDDAQTTDPGTVDTGNTGKGTDSMNAGAGAVTGAPVSGSRLQIMRAISLAIRISSVVLPDKRNRLLRFYAGCLCALRYFAAA